ncbi:MAG: hypothetical protein ACPLKX_01755 [Dictyoglomaceae bacterium]
MEDKKVVRIFILFIILVFFILNISLAQSSSWTLKAEKIEFFWETQTFKAYGKVEIKGKDIWILADKVEGDLKEGWIKAIGNVKFKDLKGEFFAEEIKYFFKKDFADLLQVRAVYTAEGVKGNLYFLGKDLEWDKGKMIINDGRITTCDYENPHYYLSASKITYLPDDKIILDGVSLKFIFIPFSIPLFKYVVSLKKEPTPFPQLGFDGQSVFLSYPFSYSILGQLGLINFLIKHNFVTQENPYSIDVSQNYTFQNIKGTLKLNFSGNIDFESLKYPNFILNWSHEQKLLDFLFLANSLSYNLRPNENLYSFQDILKFNLSYGLNKTSLQLNYSQDNTSSRFRSLLNLNQDLDKEKTKSLLLNFRYEDNTILGKRSYEIYEDGRFIYRSKNYSLSLYQNYRISDPKNLQLIKLPEITFNGTYTFLNLPLKLEGLLGYYNEPSSYTESAKLSFGFFIPYSLKISNFNLNSNLGYRQDFYQTGDARYFIYGNISTSFKPFRLLSLSASYNFQFLGKDIITGDSGNTPFYFDYQGETSLLSGSLILGDSNFNISLSDSYNFLLNSLAPLSVRVRCDLRKIFIIEGSTSLNWNLQKFSPILVQSILNYPSFISLAMGVLLNPYLENPLQRMDYKLTIDIKGDWHIAGKLTLWGIYPSFSFYPIVSLDKDLHCFTGKFTWDPNNGNIQFEIALKAIPTKKIGGEVGPSGFSLLPTF